MKPWEPLSQPNSTCRATPQAIRSTFTFDLLQKKNAMAAESDSRHKVTVRCLGCRLPQVLRASEFICFAKEILPSAACDPRLRPLGDQQKRRLRLFSARCIIEPRVCDG